MSTLPLRHCLLLEIKETVNKYDFIYKGVDPLKKIENSILNGSYKLSPFRVKSVLKGFPFKMDRVCFFRFDTLEEVDREFYLRLKLEDELILISLANALQKYIFTPNVFLEQSFANSQAHR